MNYNWNNINSFLKERMNRIWEVLQDNTIFFALLVLYIGFCSYWETMINERIVDSFLKNFEPKLIIDVLFIIAVVVCIIMIFVRWGKNIKPRTKLLSLIAIVFWGYYRMFSDCFDFMSLSLCDKFRFLNLKYFDIVLVYAICKLIPLIGVKKTKFIYYDGFLKDNPINDIRDDTLGRTKFAQDVIDKILETDTSNGSFSFGIDSPWGAGKTSFMNLMKKWIDYRYAKECIVIDFNPWLYSGEKNLVSVFFDELSKSLKKYNYSLANSIIDYSKALSSISTTETKLVSSLIEMTNQKSLLQDKVKRIKKSISTIRKKIIVFIDDIDRLDTDELVEMLKLVRNVSDFPYMYFVIAYDKNYVINCLRSKMKTKETEFAEKIFQVEFHLPLYVSRSLKEILINHLKNNLTENDRKEIQEFVKNSFPDATLTSLRVINRLSNSFNTSYALLKGSINVCDLLLLELLKTKYPTVFSLFELKRSEILENNNNLLSLSKGPRPSHSNGLDLLSYIEKNKDELCLNTIDIEDIKTVLTLLFPQNTSNSMALNRHIYETDCMNRYFNISVSSTDINEHDFNELMQKPINEIKPIIVNWTINNVSPLVSRLIDYETNDLEQHIKMIDLMFYFLSLNPPLTPSVLEINERILKYEASSEDEVKAIKNAIINSINKYGYNRGVGIYLYWKNLNQGGAYPLTKEELNDLRYNLLNDSITINPRPIDEVLDCFTSTTIANDESGTDFQCLLKNKDLMISYIDNNLFEFIKRIIISLPQENMFGLDNSIIKSLWGMDDFILYIEKMKNGKTGEEKDNLDSFHRFLLAYKNNNYNDYIKYDFSFSI